MFWKKFISIICVLLPSGLSRILFRCAGYRVGENARLSFLSYVHAGQLEIGNDVDIRPFVVINLAKCTIGNNTIVSFGTQIIGDKRFSTGENCFIGPHCIIHCEEDVSLGFYSGLGARCMIYTHGSFLPVNRGYPAKFAAVVLDDYVWTAMGVMFLPGSHVETDCIINPGIVVSGRIPSGTLLQIDGKQIQRIAIDKIKRFAKRDAKYYHNQIVTSFLATIGHSQPPPPNAPSFETPDGIRFESDAEANLLYLYLSGRPRPIIYDIEGYYCSQSSEKIHDCFLRFLRRQFGLTLRTDYTGRSLNRRRES